MSDELKTDAQEPIPGTPGHQAISEHGLKTGDGRQTSDAMGRKDVLEDLGVAVVHEALVTHGSQAKAAAALGVSGVAVSKFLKRHGLNPDGTEKAPTIKAIRMDLHKRNLARIEMRDKYQVQPETGMEIQKDPPGTP